MRIFLITVFPYRIEIRRAGNAKRKKLVAVEIQQGKAEDGFVAGGEANSDTVMPGQPADEFLRQVPDSLRALESLRRRQIKVRPQRPRINGHADTGKSQPSRYEDRHAHTQHTVAAYFDNVEPPIGRRVHPPFLVERIGMRRNAIGRMGRKRYAGIQGGSFIEE
ncbi:hypothetical protein [Gluconacetobacter sacchari]|uniref:Uncharacterized protein n=1 Tax=Gluconacetobacter sacchari TaxID=92759 RepID=A0A7W4NL72_9PROT|nr:hypothetical protein [Gluconacetobacter sacchari]MBB2159777.1 hypothetical protein [Gluconacetobacter sacchari]